MNMTARNQRQRRWRNGFLLLAPACFGVTTAFGQLELATDQPTQSVFAGEGRKIAVVWRNAGDKTVDVELRTRLYQTTCATAVQLSETTWKRLQVLPGQTVIESALLSFPAVKAETRFLVQWLEGTNTVLGKTEVLVYPTNLLAELKALAGDEPLGVFDPSNQLKPLLKTLKIEFVDLENSGLEDFRGKLAIVGPFESKVKMPPRLGNKIKKLAAKGMAVVWIQPPPEIRLPPSRREGIKPSFCTVPEGKGAVVVVQAGLVSDLSESPQAQLNLIQFARLALGPELPRLPDLTQQP
jgi:hypothetical protein